MDVKAPRGMTPPKGAELRHTERSDTDNHIDKEDMDRHRRGKKNTDEYERTDIYDDLTQVSIKLLRGFLQGLLDTRDKLHDTRREHAIKSNPAVQAYQTAKFMAPDTPRPAPEVDENVEVVGFSRKELAAEGLNQDEIKSLMSALAHLDTAGVHFIEMQRADSFLISIKEAIERVSI